MTNLPQRDLWKDERLAEELRELGYECWVTPFLPNNRGQILYYKPHIVVIPEARCEYTVAFGKQCREWGIRVVAKRCEPGAAKEAYDIMSEDEKKTVVGTWNYGESLDLELVWSDDFKDIVLGTGYLPPEKIEVCGAFSFDYCFNEDGSLSKPPESPRPSGVPHILFCPGWGHADRSPEYNVPEAPPGSPLHRDAWTRHNYGRERWIDMIKKVARALGKGAEYFISVKTGELPIAYQNTIGKYAKILQPCPSSIMVQNADILIHPGSTLAISAHLWGKPAFSFYGNVNQATGYDYPHVSPNFEDVDKLIAAIKAVEINVSENTKTKNKIFNSKTNANVASIKKLEKDYYGKIDGQAHKRAAAAIAKLSIIEDVKEKIPVMWPNPIRDIEVPGVFKYVAQWKCECCGQVSVTDMKREMIKCPWCGISLAKRLEDNQVVMRARQGN